MTIYQMCLVGEIIPVENYDNIFLINRLNIITNLTIYMDSLKWDDNRIFYITWLKKEINKIILYIAQD